MEKRKLARKKAIRRRKIRRRLGILFLLILFSIIAVVGVKLLSNLSTERKIEALKNAKIPDFIDVQLIDVDGHARRGVDLKAIKSIVIHYVGNPATTAQQNRDYFNNEDVNVSSHFVVGLKGEIIQCVPLNEISSASNNRNIDTISIEVCHPDASGKFNDETYKSLLKLTAWLCYLCDLDSEDIIRHYDVTGKLCPLYYVEHEDAWLQFKEEVAAFSE